MDLLFEYELFANDELLLDERDDDRIADALLRDRAVDDAVLRDSLDVNLVVPRRLVYDYLLLGDGLLNADAAGLVLAPADLEIFLDHRHYELTCRGRAGARSLWRVMSSEADSSGVTILALPLQEIRRNGNLLAVLES